MSCNHDCNQGRTCDCFPLVTGCSQKALPIVQTNSDGTDPTAESEQPLTWREAAFSVVVWAVFFLFFIAVTCFSTGSIVGFFDRF